MNERTAHMDLLDQVERDQATRDAVRRMLAQPLPLTEADLDAHERWKRQPWPIGATNHAHRYSRCASGPCASGTVPCPTPDACALADEQRLPKRAGDLVRVVALFLAGWAAVALAMVAMGVRL